MKAAIFKGKGRIDVEQVVKPVPGPGEVLVKVAFCGVCGTDVHIFEGSEGAAKTTPPTILGHEFSGTVAEVGEGVTELSVDDRVVVDPNNQCGECYYCRTGIGHFCEKMIAYGTIQNGGFSEYCAVHRKQVYRLPPDLSLEHAAMAEPVSCCLHGIDECGIRPGGTVLIIGAGPIGLLMLQLARMSGAARIIVSEPVEQKRKLAGRLGADLLIDPKSGHIGEILAGCGVFRIETVIDCVGLPSTMEQAIDLAGKKSTVMLFGLGAPSDTIRIRPFSLFKNEITVKSSFTNPYTIGRAIEIIASGAVKLDDILVRTVVLEELADVLKNPEKRAGGKILVDPTR